MKRSKHNLSHTRLLSCDMAELVPIALLEILPGDSVRMNSTALVRAAPLLAPVMHPVRVRIHHWFVPHRLSWVNWEDFITGGRDGLNASVFPTIAAGAIASGQLSDYLGGPTGAVPARSALPTRGYTRIYNDWYRDQDLITPLPISTADGVDGTTNQTMRNVAWEKDYFTSARPWELKGPAVSIPVTGSGAVVFSETGATPGVRTLNRLGAGAFTNTNVVEGGTAGAAIVGNVPTISGNITVNALRQALAVQRFEEARAQYGSRYVEYLAALGVRSADGRLDRPEYLGGGSQTIQFSEVLQTAADGANPVGTMRGHGITALRSNTFQRFFDEHGYIFSLMSVLPKTIYQNGMPKTYNRRTKFDFWTRELESIGQQAILNKEIYAPSASPDGVFGYQNRYDEYREEHSSVHGEFNTSTLNYWHMNRIFGVQPTLNSTFVEAVPRETSFAVPAQDVIYAQVRNSVKMRRLVSSQARPRTF